MSDDEYDMRVGKITQEEYDRRLAGKKRKK
jgi:hypothetical protein